MRSRVPGVTDEVANHKIIRKNKDVKFEFRYICPAAHSTLQLISVYILRMMQNMKQTDLIKSIRKGYNLPIEYFEAEITQAHDVTTVAYVTDLEQLTGNRFSRFYVSTGAVRGKETIERISRILANPLQPYAPGIALLTEILAKRIDLALFEKECYKEAIRYSGGSIRELLRIIRSAALI